MMDWFNDPSETYSIWFSKEDRQTQLVKLLYQYSISSFIMKKSMIYLIKMLKIEYYKIHMKKNQGWNLDGMLPLTRSMSKMFTFSNVMKSLTLWNTFIKAKRIKLWLVIKWTKILAVLIVFWLSLFNRSIQNQIVHKLLVNYN